MSGVEVSKDSKENQINVCKSCMNSVIQSFTHFQEHIAKLKQDKEKLQTELEKAWKDQNTQKRALVDEIKALEEKLAALKQK